MHKHFQVKFGGIHQPPAAAERTTNNVFFDKKEINTKGKNR